nr:hypothetical protein [Tanacetum cinerariifolium]
MSLFSGTIFKVPPYPFNYPTRRLPIEEILDKFIDEGKRKHEEMEIFIKEFRTTNELLLKERSNLLRVTTRGGKITSEATRSKEINETGINKNEPPRFEQDMQEKPHDVGVKHKSSSIPERTTQSLVKPQQSSIPFLNRVRKEQEEAQQRKFLENLKQLHINIILKEACMVTMNEKCSAVLLKKLPAKEKDLGSFTISCQVSNLRTNNALAELGASISLMPYTIYEKLGLGKPTPNRMSLELADRVGADEVIFDKNQSNIKTKDKKGAENLDADNLSRLENPHIEVLIEREIADKFHDEHLMVLKSKFDDDEPWYADFVNYIVGKTRPRGRELAEGRERAESTAEGTDTPYLP